MSIPFTQFLMPDGRRKPITIDRPPDIEVKAQAILKAGCVFEIEMLRSGAISMEILRRPPEESDEDCEIIAAEFCANGPGVPVAVDKMITEAFDTISAVKAHSE